jgi:hypothetical protein
MRPAQLVADPEPVQNFQIFAMRGTTRAAYKK